ncbi:MAG: hypothetical protein IT499_06125 [Rubrivivax sp.]|jgi:hypothetical protein|nr:hypothetical protein [Rubrivivax sp.]MCL4696074.1 hypothetical protein [Burkholderiaceae bacterium]
MAITPRSQRIARQRRPRRNPPENGGAVVSVVPAVAPDAPAPPAPQNGGTNLRLPHERDQSVDAQQGPREPVIEQAWRDIESGQVDTDMHATPGLDAQRRRRLVPGSR